MAGLEEPPAADVDFSGADPVFRTPYRIGTAGAASLAAVGVAASQLWRLRTGKRQRIGVDVRAAAASLRSSRYLRVDGGPPPDVWDPLSGFYPVAGRRWVSVHCNFAGHRDAALRVLGTAGDRAAAETASRGWDGLALEDAIHAAGGCAGLARDAAEWAQHPQYAAVAAQPLLAIDVGNAAWMDPAARAARHPPRRVAGAVACQPLRRVGGVFFSASRLSNPSTPDWRITWSNSAR